VTKPQNSSAKLAYPALFTSVDRAAAEQQGKFFTLKVVELSAIVAGSLVGVLAADDLWGTAGGVAVVCFLIAAAIRISGNGQVAEKRWYDARAAAESVKSLSWQYAVAGEAFRRTDTNPDAVFVNQLRTILTAVPHLDIPAGSDPGVTQSMRELRAAEQAERQRRYISERVQDQVDWYAQKANWNKRRSLAWSAAVVLVELLAVCLGIARISGAIEVDLLGVLGAFSAGLIAWIQAKNYTELSESYSVTSHEVGMVASTVRAATTEEVWAQNVHDAEAAFSREHTMWLARRQSRLSM